MKTCFLLFGLFLSTQTLFSQAPIEYFLPDISYDAEIKSPEAFLGYPSGKWHIGHDQLISYMRYLAEASDRISIKETGRTHEDRPLLLLTITHPENQLNLENIRQKHLQLQDPSKADKLDLKTMPSVVYQGFSIHGNEASGSNAAPLVAYYLAAGQGKEIERLLRNVVVLFDPSLNPDGLNRFASWVNTHKSSNRQADSNTREHNETWPGARTNHYWFDLNRDWLLVAHPESQARIREYHQWKPNILTDHHEMGTNSTFFFQPGVPERTNPLTPQKNQDLTGKIGTFHVEALDEIGSLYYSKESFDDFYIGKGSTYPDVNGCIGILFEQASARGHVQESIHGDLSFEFTIRNQVKTALSTLKAGLEMKEELLEYQRDFFKLGFKEAASDPAKAFVFGDTQDESRLHIFVNHLLQHDIKVYPLDKDITAQGKSFQAGKAFVVPTSQAQYRLVKGMFETYTSFTDSLFYDVSAWTLPMAYNLSYARLSAYAVNGKKALDQAPDYQPESKMGSDNYAYLIDWRNYYAPKVVNELLEAGLVLKVANEPFSIQTSDKLEDFPRGTIVLSAINQEISKIEIEDLLNELGPKNGVEIYSVSTGATLQGIDLGSPSMSPLRQPKALLLIGSGVSSYDAGEVWHLMDKRFGIDLSLVDVEDFGRLDLDRYKTLILVNGGYGGLNSHTDKLEDWLRKGGSLIAMEGANRWLEQKGLAGLSYRNGQKRWETRPYSERNRDSGAQVIGGAIFEARLDLSHPLAYGYTREELPVFRSGTMFFNPPANPYAGPVNYTSDPLLSGYISSENLERLKGSCTVIVSKVGSGKVISLADNPNFRAYWYGTNRLFLNSVFLGHTISGSACETPAPKPDSK